MTTDNEAVTPKSADEPRSTAGTALLLHAWVVAPQKPNGGRIVARGFSLGVNSELPYLLWLFADGITEPLRALNEEYPEKARAFIEWIDHEGQGRIDFFRTARGGGGIGYGMAQGIAGVWTDFRSRTLNAAKELGLYEGPLNTVTSAGPAQGTLDGSFILRPQRIVTGKYTVLVDDNFHLHDEDERYEHGKYDSAAEAIATAKQIVEDSLAHQFQPGMTAKELLDRYIDFGDDPFVKTPSGAPRVEFSAWTYATERVEDYVRERNGAPATNSE